MEHQLAVALEHLRVDADDGMDAMTAVINELSMSTAFSGTGGPEVSLHSMCCCLRHFSGTASALEPKHLFGIEVLQESQYELLMLPEKLECLFCDMTDCTKQDRVRQVLRQQHCRQLNSR